jgi:hypothetical protein
VKCFFVIKTDTFYIFSVTPILFFGTALGWYRQCTIVAHMIDIDFAAPIHEFTPEILSTVKEWDTKLGLVS